MSGQNFVTSQELVDAMKGEFLRLMETESDALEEVGEALAATLTETGETSTKHANWAGWLLLIGILKQRIPATCPDPSAFVCGVLVAQAMAIGKAVDGREIDLFSLQPQTTN